LFLSRDRVCFACSTDDGDNLREVCKSIG
jgi:hypothetical protein